MLRQHLLANYIEGIRSGALFVADGVGLRAAKISLPERAGLEKIVNITRASKQKALTIKYGRLFIKTTN
jgi:hypothetical protein